MVDTFKIVSIVKKNIKFVHIRPYKKVSQFHFQRSSGARASLVSIVKSLKAYVLYVDNDIVRLVLFLRLLN